MSERPRTVFVCPGPDAYGPAWLGSLPPDHPAVHAAERIRVEYGLEPLRALDGAGFDPNRHLRPANAAPLTFMVSLLDAERAEQDQKLVGVVGSAGGWHGALAVAGALPFEDAFRLTQEVALLREQAFAHDHGGQVIYPLLDGDWKPNADLRAALADILADGGGQHTVFTSIELGGFAVLAGDEPAVAHLLERLPSVAFSGRRFPMRLAMQGPDHTPLAEEVAETAADRLSGLRWQQPHTTLIDGRGARWTPWSSDPDTLRDYTLGAQLTAPYRFATAVRVALRELAPELVVAAGPRSSLAGILGQLVVEEGYRGVRSRGAFEAAQRSAAPIVLSMGHAA
jgi:acyl transferase domain-containing protein